MLLLPPGPVHVWSVYIDVAGGQTVTGHTHARRGQPHNHTQTFHTHQAIHVPWAHTPDTNMLAICTPRTTPHIAHPIEHAQSRTELSHTGPHPLQGWTNMQTEAQSRPHALTQALTGQQPHLCPPPPLLRLCGAQRSWHFLSQHHPYFPDALPLPLLSRLSCFLLISLLKGTPWSSGLQVFGSRWETPSGPS